MVWVLLFGLLLFILIGFDVPYLIETVIIYIKARKRCDKLMDTSSYWSWVGLGDLDLYVHMNNARYLRACDLGRIKLWLSNGVLKELQKKDTRGFIVLGASTIRYRRSLEPFETYTVKSKILSWDDKSFYVEQRFVTKDGFVKAIVLGQQWIVGPSPQALVDILQPGLKSPSPPEELENWMKFIKSSSAKLKAERAKAE